MISLLTLGFDTSGPHCAAALFRDGQIIGDRLEPMTRGQAERLMPLLEEVLADGRATWQDLNAIGVGVGPGNFTGIRIAVSAARGLALGLNIPAVGVTGFEMRAAPGVLPSVPAPRDQVFIQTDGAEPRLVPLAEAEELARKSELKLSAEQSPPDMAGIIARCAAERYQMTTEPPAPFYARSADAAPSRDTPPAILDA